MYVNCWPFWSLIILFVCVIHWPWKKNQMKFQWFITIINQIKPIESILKKNPSLCQFTRLQSDLFICLVTRSLFQQQQKKPVKPPPQFNADSHSYVLSLYRYTAKRKKTIEPVNSMAIGWNYIFVFIFFRFDHKERVNSIRFLSIIEVWLFSSSLFEDIYGQ